MKWQILKFNLKFVRIFRIRFKRVISTWTPKTPKKGTFSYVYLLGYWCEDTEASPKFLDCSSSFEPAMSLLLLSSQKFIAEVFPLIWYECAKNSGKVGKKCITCNMWYLMIQKLYYNQLTKNNIIKNVGHLLSCTPTLKLSLQEGWNTSTVGSKTNVWYKSA